MSNVLEISSRKFRENQRAYFDLADNGTRLIIKRGENKSYVIVPIDMNELYFSPVMEKRLDKSIQNINEGKGEEYTVDQIDQLLGL